MRVTNSFYSAIEDLIALFYPNTCIVCGENLLKKEECICTLCLYKLPKTDCFRQQENSVSKLFWGRVQLQNAIAVYQFHKEGGVQKLIHELKYTRGIIFSPYLYTLKKKNLEAIIKVNILLKGYKKYCK